MYGFVMERRLGQQGLYHCDVIMMSPSGEKLNQRPMSTAKTNAYIEKLITDMKSMGQLQLKWVGFLFPKDVI